MSKLHEYDTLDSSGLECSHNPALNHVKGQDKADNAPWPGNSKASNLSICKRPLDASKSLRLMDRIIIYPDNRKQYNKYPEQANNTTSIKNTLNTPKK